MFPKAVIYYLVVVVDVNLNVVSATTYVQTLHATRLLITIGHLCKTFLLLIYFCAFTPVCVCQLCISLYIDKV